MHLRSRREAGFLFRYPSDGAHNGTLLGSRRRQRPGRCCASILLFFSPHLLQHHPSFQVQHLPPLQTQITSFNSRTPRVMPPIRSILRSSKSGAYKVFSEFDDIATKLLIDCASRDVIAYNRPAWNPPGLVRKMGLSFHSLQETSFLENVTLIDVSMFFSASLSSEVIPTHCQTY